MRRNACIGFIFFVFVVMGISGVLHYLFGSASASDVIRVDAFTKKPNSAGMPGGWKVKVYTGTCDINVEKEGNNDVLLLCSKESSFGVAKNLGLDLKAHPVLNWRWKAGVLPCGGDFRKKETDDQAGQIYLIFKTGIIGRKIVGYLWENKAPAGITGVSPRSDNYRYIVLRDSTHQLNTWFTEKRNVYEDFKRLFGMDPPEISSIALLINSHHTKSSAQIYYDDIYFSKG